jgi:predicted nucleic acid-binding protein
VIVLDASAVIEVLMKSAMGTLLSGRLHTVRLVHAPHLIDIEVSNALRRQCSLGSLAAVRGRQALEDFRNMRILRYRHTIHLARIWELRDNFTSYDACYLALAEALGATLITRDKALRSARLRRGNIEVI